MAAGEESHKNRVDTPQASHPNPQSAYTVVSSTQFTSTAKSTVIPSTQYLSGGIITTNLTTFKAVATITTQENGGFIPIEELEARQVVQTAEVTKATQPKKRGRPPGSKDHQLHKRMAKKVPKQEEQDVAYPYALVQDTSLESIDLV